MSGEKDEYYIMEVIFLSLSSPSIIIIIIIIVVIILFPFSLIITTLLTFQVYAYYLSYSGIILTIYYILS